MTPGDTARVLATCSLYDYRFGDPSPELLAAWFKALGDLDGDDAIEAVARHYAVSEDRIMPAHIRRGVKAIREERRHRTPIPERALPSRFEDDINRSVRLERGAATVRGVLGPLLEHLAAQRPELPSAMDELRALTAEATVVDGETTEGVGE